MSATLPMVELTVDDAFPTAQWARQATRMPFEDKVFQPVDWDFSGSWQGIAFRYLTAKRILRDLRDILPTTKGPHRDYVLDQALFDYHSNIFALFDNYAFAAWIGLAGVYDSARPKLVTEARPRTVDFNWLARKLEGEFGKKFPNAAAAIDTLQHDAVFTNAAAIRNSMTHRRSASAGISVGSGRPQEIMAFGFGPEEVRITLGPDLINSWEHSLENWTRTLVVGLSTDLDQNLPAFDEGKIVAMGKLRYNF